MTTQTLRIHPIPILQDNYVWTLIDDNKKQAVIVDPGESAPVEDFLLQNQLTLRAILITHHHLDHTNGILSLVEKNAVPVFAPATENIMGKTHPVQAGDKINIPDFPLHLTVLAIPGHTLGHVAYYESPMLFCGDTLFASGCGRIFEGTPEQMYASLQQLAALPLDTKVYCAHEYTLNNLLFAKTAEPNNQEIIKRLAIVKALREKDQPTLPSLLADEKATNPFLRCDSPELIAQVTNQAGKSLENPAQVFAELRKWKDHFKA